MPAVLSTLVRYRTPMLWIGGFIFFALFVILNRDLPTFLSYFILGLPQGAIIALIAVGYSMVYGIIQLINFAHGEVFMFSTYFALMFLVPAAGSDMLGLQVVSAVVALLTACTAWVVLSNRIRGGAARLAAAVTFGALIGWLNLRFLPTSAGATLPFFLAVLIAIFYACCLGVSMDLLAYKPLRNSPRLIPLITAIGLSLLLQNFAQSIWGSASRDFPREVRPEFLVRRDDDGRLLGPAFVDVVEWTSNEGTKRVISLPAVDVLIICMAIVLLVGLQVFIHRTRTGKAMRACAQDRTTASLMGIQVNRMVALAFAIGAALAAIAAPLYILRGTFMNPTMGYIVGILAFSSAVLGGIGNITGAMLGGMIIGVIYSFVPLFDRLDTFRIFQVMESWGWVTAEGWREGSRNFGSPGQYTLGVAYAFMIMVIVFKPTGLLGRASAKRA